MSRHSLSHARPSLALSSMAVGLLLLTSACGVRPKPLTLHDHIARADADRAAVEAHYVPLKGYLTLCTAIARALKFNYDAQVAKLEINQQEKQVDLSLMQMLPHLAADAGYTQRSNNNAAESIDWFSN